jgi:hypothetical protein
MKRAISAMLRALGLLGSDVLSIHPTRSAVVVDSGERRA